MWNADLQLLLKANRSPREIVSEPELSGIEGSLHYGAVLILDRISYLETLNRDLFFLKITIERSLTCDHGRHIQNVFGRCLYNPFVGFDDANVGNVHGRGSRGVSEIQNAGLLHTGLRLDSHSRGRLP